MIVFAVLVQPDLDWNSKADFVGVFSTKSLAKKAAEISEDAVVIRCALDVDLDPME